MGEGKDSNIERAIARLSDLLERARIADYVALYSDPRRLVWLNFVGGLARGAGLAVGFTFLGALTLYILTRRFLLDLPIIGQFLGEIVWIIQEYLRGKT